MTRRLGVLVIALLFSLPSPPVQARAIMDCYPGTLLPVRGETYQVCWIDSDNICMYCQVRSPTL